MGAGAEVRHFVIIVISVGDYERDRGRGEVVSWLGQHRDFLVKISTDRAHSGFP